jgi:hypothetical protein
LLAGLKFPQFPASLLAGNCARGGNTREQTRGDESGSKLPHSKASRCMRAMKRSPVGT